ncbi:TetR/AcrR family transcriptional regulator [Peptostreptococcus faecalis]|uniref:TetR/AcrR family transcriptional regulator n=1 Tax=Peptostreptococcus faecalis TaxID=2045015 RepID=UPI000C7E0E0D|nr:TetR/AcrR family transcriptional regulator [Peptostreptococcus faecalis]
MDLRVIKTKKLIKESFLQLRKKEPLEKIKVTEICKIALINKTTFYKHYRDIFDLSEELEKEAFENFWNSFEEKDCLLSDPYRFTLGIPRALNKHGILLHQLFHDRFEAFSNKLEILLKEYYFKPNQSPEEDIRQTFIINGAIHTLKEMKLSRKYDDIILAESISSLIESLRNPPSVK